MKKILIIFLIIFSAPLCLLAQTTIGESKEQIRKLVQSNPNFKLLPGNNCDTLSFAEEMQAIFLYKDNICYRSTSVMPLKYKDAIIEKMTTDSYKKINDNTWIDSKETIQVEVQVDKNKRLCFVTTTSFNKTAKN